MRDKTIRALGATAVLLAVATAALAQIPAEQASTTEIAQETTSTASTALPSSSSRAPVEPFEYRIGLLSGITTDNYWRFYGMEPTAWNAYVLGPTKAGLYGLNTGGGSLVVDLAGETPPVLVESGGRWSVELVMVGGATWSDGHPITAGDMAFTFATVRSLNLGGGWADAFPAEVENVEAVTDRLLRITFTQRPPLSVWPYAVGLAPVMAEHVWGSIVAQMSSADELYAADGSSDVSGGPLTIVSNQQTEIRVQSNPGHGSADERLVTYRIYEDEGAATAALTAGEIDTILSPKGLSSESQALIAGSEDIEIVSSPANAVRYLGFNLTRDPMSSRAFRMAVSLLVDREAAIDLVGLDAAAAYTLMPAANATWFDQEEMARIRAVYQPAAEKRLDTALQGLAAAGYAWTSPPRFESGKYIRGEGVTINGAPPAPLTILTSGDAYDPDRPAYAALIESAIEVLGFDVSVLVTDFETVVDLAFTKGEAGQRQYDMYLSGWTLGNPALPDYHRSFFAADGEVNSTGYASTLFEESLDAYESTFNVADARTALWAMESIVTADLPYLPLYHPRIVEAYRKDRIYLPADGWLGGIQGQNGGLTVLSPVEDPEN